MLKTYRLKPQTEWQGVYLQKVTEETKRGRGRRAEEGRQRTEGAEGRITGWGLCSLCFLLFKNGGVLAAEGQARDGKAEGLAPHCAGGRKMEGLR